MHQCENVYIIFKLTVAKRRLGVSKNFTIFLRKSGFVFYGHSVPNQAKLKLFFKGTVNVSSNKMIRIICFIIY